MEDASEINKHLPVSNEKEYTAYLYNAFETNYANGIYQFAFLAYYMLLMSFVSFKIWQVNRNLSSKVMLSQHLKKQLNKTKAPLTLDRGNTTMNRHILQFIESLLPVNTFESLTMLRNSIAHVNGRIHVIDRDISDQGITEVLEIINRIECKLKHVIENCYFNFLLDSRNPEGREDMENANQINEVLIHKNCLSEQDIAYCVGYDIAILQDYEGFDEMKSLHETLLQLYPPEVD